MSKTVEIKCDQCGRDLSATGNCIDYRLALLNQEIPTQGGANTLMMSYPALDQDSYFCGTRCLKAWISANLKKVEMPEDGEPKP